MSTYTIKQAKDQLSELIDRARDGEGVAIERDGEVVAEIRPVTHTRSAPITRATLDRLARNRIKLKPGVESPTETLRRIRDEY